VIYSWFYKLESVNCKTQPLRYLHACKTVSIYIRKKKEGRRKKMQCVCFLSSFYGCGLKKISFKKIWLAVVS